MENAESSLSRSAKRLATLLSEIAGDFNIPGEVTALPSDCERRHLIFEPRDGVRIACIFALKDDIAIELGAVDLRIESAPAGTKLEFQFSDDRLRHLRAMLR